MQSFNPLMSPPRVSVLMSVYNGERYLQEAVQSILDQTETNFEFIIIDDGSVDTTWMILNDYDDARIQLVRNEKNIGLSGSLNKGLTLARGEYIARMDSDDISMPHRLEKQIKYLELHPEIGVIGGWVQKIDNQGKITSEVNRVENESGVIKWRMHFNNPIAHPTVVIRRSLLKLVGGYSSDIAYSQDYDLWARMSKITQFANYPEMLLYFRKHSSSVSASHITKQKEISVSISQNLISITLNKPVELDLVLTLRGYKQPSGDTEQIRVIILIYNLLRAFIPIHPLTDIGRKIIRKDASKRIYKMLRDHNLGHTSLAKGMVFALLADPCLPAKNVFYSISRRFRVPSSING